MFTFGAPGLIFVPELPPMYRLKSMKRIAKETGGIVLDGPYLSRVNETRLNACACLKCGVVMCFYNNGS